MSNRNGNFRTTSNFEAPDPYEQLSDVMMWTHNRRVREEFRDITPEDEEWVVDNINTPRARLRWATTIKEEDSATMIMMRMWLFYVIMGKAAEFQAPVYGIPVNTYQETWKFKPQIQLYFQEDIQDVDVGYSPVTGEISFRLMNQTEETLTEAEVRVYAQRVKSSFAIPNSFVWKKGKVQAVYTDPQRGYRLRLLVRTSAEAKRIIEQMLDLQQHTPDWKFMNVSENEEPAQRFPTVPAREMRLGRLRRMPRQRPIADVRFQYALLHVHGLPAPIVLIDRAGIFRNPLVEAY